MLSSTSTKVYRFGTFELNTGSRQLLRNGREIHLQDQPMRLLLSLVERPGELLTRDKLREKLWPTETFVEFDDGLNTAVQKIRQVLGDDARNPRFVETAPRKGYRFIAPVLVDEGLRPAIESGIASDSVHIQPAAPRIKISSHPPYSLWIALASAAIGLALGWWLPRRAVAPGAPPLKLSITPPPGVELRPGFRGGSAVAPDGRTVVFVASRNGKTRLWLRSLDSKDARELPGTDDAQNPFWSPDGKSVGFMAGRRLRTIDLAGGPPQDLADASRSTRGAWCEDGTILFSPGRGEPLYRVRQSGGRPLPATEAAAGAAYWPYALPGTDRFLYFDEGRGSVALGSLSDIHLRKILFPADSNAVYTPPHDGQPGYVFWLRGTTLVGQAFDARSGRLAGDTLPVAEGVGFADHVRFVDLSASRNGVLLYGAGDTVKRRLAWLRRDGSVLDSLGEPSWLRAVRLSPDGHRAVIEQGITRTLWMENFDRKVLTRLTYEQHMSGWTAWSPDGSQVAYSAERGGHLRLFLRDADGATPERQLAASPYDLYMYDWSRDGRYIAYCETNPQTKIDVWIFPLTGERKPFPLLQTPFNEDSPQFSPDGRWIAYVSDETGRNEVYVASFPERSGKWQISTGGGTLPRWTGRGRELFYVAADGNLMSVPLNSGRRQFEWSAPRRVFTMWIPGTSYDVTAGGDRFLVLQPTDDVKANELTVLLNWRPLIHR
jgi:Tol biopolymer transport system component/DNA-binding winged helix-turn-helix (wHTH) protein